MMDEINSSELEKYLSENDETACVMFVRDNSAPCETMKKILNQYLDINKSQKFFVVKLDKEISAKYGIESVPTLIVFEQGQPVNKRFGTLSIKDLDEMLVKKKNCLNN